MRSEGCRPLGGSLPTSLSIPLGVSPYKPPNKNIIGSKWTLRIKRKANGEIDKYKV